MNKTLQVLEYFGDTSCDICLVQETFLKDADKAILKEIADFGWSILSDPRKHRSGGGIAILSRPDIHLKNNEKVKKYKSFQVMEALVSCKTGLVRLVNIYRPPYTKKARFTESMFLEDFDDYLNGLIHKPGKAIIAGDFNIHVERPDDIYPKKFLNLLSNYNLHQCVPLVATHNMGGTLDLIITTRDIMEKFKGPVEVVASGTKSDHYLVYVDVQLKIDSAQTKKALFTSYRNFNDVDVNNFKQDIIDSELGKQEFSNTLDEAVSLYNNVLLELMDKHRPVINKRRRRYPLEGS